MSEEVVGPHANHCPLRRPKSWRDIYDRYATCHCSNETLARILGGAR